MPLQLYDWAKSAITSVEFSYAEASDIESEELLLRDRLEAVIDWRHPTQLWEHMHFMHISHYKQPETFCWSKEAHISLMSNQQKEIIDIGKFIALYRKENNKWHLQTDMFNSSLETRSPIEVPDYLSLPKNR